VDDEVVIVRSSQLACQPVVHKPQLWPCLPRVLGDGSRGLEQSRERRPSYGPTEGSRTWWVGRGTPILLTVVASSALGVVASAHPLIEAGSGEDAIPPEVEVDAEPWGWARRRPPSEAEVGAEP
jgi:hypothetical protein